MDRVSKRVRSANMRAIRGVNTAPELAVRRLLHAMGFRYRLHRRDLPGRPDLTFSRLRKIIFVHGCFWHQHAGCSLSHSPKSRQEYWGPKLKANVERDDRHVNKLAALGWDVLVIWECETNNRDKLIVSLRNFLVAAPATASRAG